MAQTPDSDLAARILRLESVVRALQTAASNRGAVTAAEDSSSYRIDAPVNVAGTTAWVTDQGPTLDVFVPGGRLLVDWSVQQDVYAGGGAVTAVGRSSYQIVGPSDSAGYGLDVAAVLRPPDFTRAALVKDKGGAASMTGTPAAFDLVTGLAVGWYRVSLAYNLTYNSSTSAPFHIASNRVLTATAL